MSRKTPGTKESGLRAAITRGATAKAQWVESGEVVPASALAARWQVTASSIGASARRGGLTSVVISRRRYFPSAFLELEPESAGAVSRALSPLPPQTALVFWKRPHGALGGKTAAEALRIEAGLDRVLGLAQSWSGEAAASPPPALEAEESETRRFDVRPRFFISSEELQRRPVTARRRASEGPVVVTERGRPTHVLLSIEAYQALLAAQMARHTVDSKGPSSSEPPDDDSRGA